MSHSAATPVGMTVTAEVELVSVEGRELRIKIVCRDDAEIVSEGFHERFIIDPDKFMRRLGNKGGRSVNT